jgi:arylsulfatase A-like enzyme
LFINDRWARSPERISRVPTRKEAGFGNNKILGTIPAYQILGSEDRRAIYVARYDAEIRFVDNAFGEIMDELKIRGLYDQSAIVFTSDHGESLGEHDYFFEHGWYIYEPSMRIPLLLKWPHQTKGDRRAASVSQLDLLPTLLAIAGLESQQESRLGVDLQNEIDTNRVIALESADLFPEKYFGARSTKWKYTVRERDGLEELYDLVEDPKELQNLVSVASRDSEPGEALRDLRAQLKVLHEIAPPIATPTSKPSEPLDEETRRALIELGYIDGDASPSDAAE